VPNSRNAAGVYAIDSATVRCVHKFVTVHVLFVRGEPWQASAEVIRRTATDSSCWFQQILEYSAGPMRELAMRYAAVCYEALTLPRAALMLLIDVRCVELCAAVFDAVGHMMCPDTRYLTEYVCNEKYAKGERLHDFRFWCPQGTSMQLSYGHRAEWAVMCIAGPLSTRKAVREALSKFWRAINQDHAFPLNRYMQVLAYEPPRERRVDMGALTQLLVQRLKTTVYSTIAEIPDSNITREDCYWLPQRNSIPFYEEDLNIDAFVTTNAPNCLIPFTDGHYRWSYWHDICREYVLVLLCAHTGAELQLPHYIVNDIMCWMDPEFVWRSTELQRINLISGVSRSVKNVYARRYERSRKSRTVFL
jgi:hypothetical protein